MPGEHHEFGLMAMALALSRLGWRTCYLGADAPTAELALTCQTLHPEAVVLTAHHHAAFDAHVEALRRIAECAPLHIAGPGASGDVSELCHASHLDHDPVRAARVLHDELGGTVPHVDSPTAV
jgi:hypothetical protein